MQVRSHQTAMTNHFFQKIRDAISERESRTFLETPAGVSWTYAGVAALSARYASALAELGLEAGDRVAVQVEKSPEALMLYLGAIRAGAVFLPLNPAYTNAELDYFLGDAEPTILICDPARRAGLAPVAARAKVRSLETLGPDAKARCAIEATPRCPISRMPRAGRMILPRSCIHLAPPAARKAPC